MWPLPSRVGHGNSKPGEWPAGFFTVTLAGSDYDLNEVTVAQSAADSHRLSPGWRRPSTRPSNL